MGCLCAEKLDSGETSGSPVSQEAYGDGAVIVLNRSGQCLRHGEGEQGGSAPEAGTRNALSLPSRGVLLSGKQCARKRASTVWGGADRKGSRDTSLAAYSTSGEVSSMRRCMCEPFSRNSSSDEGMADKEVILDN